jgi:HK97 family phage major capsid protein
MQPEAAINYIRSIDSQSSTAAAPGPSTSSRPGASGETTAPRSNTMKGIPDRLAALNAQHAEKSKRMDELVTKCEGEFEKLEAGERDEYDRLNEDLQPILRDIGRLQGYQAAINKSVPVDFAVGTDPQRASRVRYGDAQMKSNLPPGTTFVRSVIAKAAGRGSISDAIQIAKQRWKDAPEVVDYLQKANAGSTVSGNWADDLSQTRIVESEFIELLRPATVLGRLQGTRSADFNTTMISQTSGSTVGWVAELAAKPVGELAFSSVTIPVSKAAGIVVLSEEQIMVSRPNSEDVVRQDLIAQMAQFLDEQFLDPSVTAVANTNPASITNGASSFAATGTDADNLRADLYRLFGYFSAASMGVSGLTLIMTSNLAMGIALLTNALGQPEFPGMTLNGGPLLGMNVIVSDNVSGSSTSGLIIAVKPSEIYIADNGGVRVDVSREATLDMAGGNTPAFSLWQKNCVGLRAERFISWAKRRSTAVAYISAAGYVPTAA